MKFSIPRDVLADAVGWTARALPTRPAVPVMAGVVIAAGDTDLQLSSFDHEVAARCSVDADVEQPGSVLVPGRLLADIARTLPNQPVSVDGGDGPKVDLTCGRARFTLPTLAIDDYPTLPEMPPIAGSLGRAEFATAVAQVAIAAGRDDTLPVLTGVRMEVTDGSLTLAATDRYRLAVREIAWQPALTGIDAAALVPARTLADAAKAFGSDALSIAYDATGSGDGLIGFADERRQTTMRLLSGEFPKYRSLLPAESSATAEVATDEFVEALRRVALVVERSTPVRLTFGEGSVVLEAGSGEGALAREEVESALDGDEITIAFNPAFLLDGLSAMGTPFTEFAFTTATKPAVLQPKVEAAGPSTADYRYLLMPVRLAG